MGLRFRKSVKICKGVRLNFSKSGIGLSLGIRGARYSIGADGKNRVSVGIPGTGIYYTSSYTRNKKDSNKINSRENNKNCTVHYSNGESYTYTPQDVSFYNELIKLLTQTHKKCSENVNWKELSASNPPYEKGTIGPLESQAKKEYDELKPSMLDKIFSSKFSSKKQELLKKLNDAKKEDEEAYQAWQTSVECSKKIISGDYLAYCDAINASDPFVELSKIGSDFEFGTDDANYVEVEFKALLDEIVPSEKLELTSTGKVSRKQLSKTEMYKIAQDYVCSCSIRLARELFALLPINYVIVHALKESKDAFGNSNEMTILSVKFERSIFEITNFEHIDPPVFISTFIHNMNFLKTQGFKSVKKIEKDSLSHNICNESNINKDLNSKSTYEIELPFGWINQNKGYIKDKDNTLYSLIEKAHSNFDTSERIKAFKELITFYVEYKNECKNKGIYFEKYFHDMHMTNSNEEFDYLGYWKKELEEIEDDYLDLKEQEDAIKKYEGTIKIDVINVLKNNNGILQKDIVKMFDPLIKQLVLDTLYQLQCEGHLVKEKEGNSKKLYYKD